MRRLVLAAMPVLVAPGWMAMATEGPSREEVAARIQDLSERVIANPVEGLVAVGPDRMGNLNLLSWSRDVTARVETLIGLPLPSSIRNLRMIVADSPAPDMPPAVLDIQAGAGRPVQVIYLRDYDAAVTPEGLGVLVYALLDVYIAAAATQSAARHIPSWLLDGLVRNLSPETRASDLESVLIAWQEGRLGPVESLINSAPAVLNTPAEAHEALTAAWQGAVVNWLTSAPERRQRFSAFFDRLGQGGTVTSDWLLTQLRSSPDDGLGDLWDRWMLRQRHTVHQVGGVSPRLMRQLRAELLLYPGSYGIPLDVPLRPGTPVDAVLAFRQADWVPVYARLAIVRLERLGIGRAERFQQVVEAWCEFLRAVLTEAPATTCRARLQTARDLQAALEAELDTVAAETD